MPRINRLNHVRLEIDRILDLLFVRKTTGMRKMNAKVYLKPANVIAGISSRPILIRTQEVAQRNTTNRAIRIAEIRDLLLSN
jgi:hypothetical protein